MISISVIDVFIFAAFMLMAGYALGLLNSGRWI